MADLSDAATEAVMLSAAWNPKRFRRDDRSTDYPVNRLPGIIGQAVQVRATCSLLSSSTAGVPPSSTRTNTTAGG